MDINVNSVDKIINIKELDTSKIKCKKSRLPKGCITALATPFKGGEIDYTSLGRLLEHQLSSEGGEGKIKSLVLSGTTGESPTLTEDEKLSVFSFVRERCDLPIIVGTGCNNTSAALRLSQKFAAEGADGILLVSPYYNKPSEPGLIRHYLEIAEGCEKPIIVYNVPGRTASDISLPALCAVCSHDNICGIKEASGCMDKLLSEIYLLSDYVNIYCGNDELNLPALLSGADGIISVLSNILPRECALLCAYAKSGKQDLAYEISKRLYPISKFLFTKANPIPLKWVLSQLGLCENELRLPLEAMLCGEISPKEL